MFTKRKLAKLMEKQADNKQEINFEILHQAKEETHWNDACEVKVVDNRKQKLIITAIISSILLCVILGIYFGVVFSKSQNRPLDPPVYYQYNENNKYKYDSVEKYNRDNNLDMLYFKGYQNVYEVVTIFTDISEDVLLEQNVLLLDTYEDINMYVQLKNNYVFGFLNQYETLSNQIVISGVQISYETNFDEEFYLYKTLTKFTYKGYVYRICFRFEGETDWQQEINKLLV